MEKPSVEQILSNLYGLLMEINIHRDDQDVLGELSSNPDSQIQKHIIRIKQLSTKYKAHANRVTFSRVLDNLKELKAKGAEELKKIFNQEEQAQLVSLFRKFDESSPKDEASLFEDEEFLNCMNFLKKKSDESDE